MRTIIFLLFALTTAISLYSLMMHPCTLCMARTAFFMSASIVSLILIHSVRTA